MNGLFFDRSPLKDVNAVISCFSNRTFSSPTRSTLPLLSWLKHEEPVWRDLLAGFRLADAALHLEYKVKPNLGRPRASQTDLMVIDAVSNRALAIEAKWTEPSDIIIKVWRKTGKTPENKEIVLGWWLQQLQKHASIQLTADSVNDVAYQALHRAASACAISEYPSMAFLAFHDEHSPKQPYIKTNLEYLWRVLGNPASFPFFYIEISIEPTSQYEPKLQLQKRQDSTIRQVKELMLSDKQLFRFGKPIIHAIGT